MSSESAFMSHIHTQLAAAQAAASAAAVADANACAAAANASAVLRNPGGCGCPDRPGWAGVAQGVLADITSCGGTPPTLAQLREDPWLLRCPSCAPGKAAASGKAFCASCSREINQLCVDLQATASACGTHPNPKFNPILVASVCAGAGGEMDGLRLQWKSADGALTNVESLDMDNVEWSKFWEHATAGWSDMHSSVRNVTVLSVGWKHELASHRDFYRNTYLKTLVPRLIRDVESSTPLILTRDGKVKTTVSGLSRFLSERVSRYLTQESAAQFEMALVLGVGSIDRRATPEAMPEGAFRTVVEDEFGPAISLYTSAGSDNQLPPASAGVMQAIGREWLIDGAGESYVNHIRGRALRGLEAVPAYGGLSPKHAMMQLVLQEDWQHYCLISSKPMPATVLPH